MLAGRPVAGHARRVAIGLCEAREAAVREKGKARIPEAPDGSDCSPLAVCCSSRRCCARAQQNAKAASAARSLPGALLLGEGLCAPVMRLPGPRRDCTQVNAAPLGEDALSVSVSAGKWPS
ncbi:hypothetical protein MRX96_016545 [Rhipicephalus microplus]